MSDPVAAFYEATGTLTTAVANGTVSSAASSYEYIIGRAGGSDPVKQLAADNIPQFFHHFPLLQERALNAQLDLIEDPSLHIRVRAIRGLEVICKHTPALIPRIADILTQLMQVEDANELHTVLATYASLFTVDHRASFTALFAQVTNNDDKKIKEKATEFLLIQLQKYWKQISANTADTAEQTEIATGIKSVLVTADGLSGKDSHFLLSHLLKLKVVREDPNMKTEVGQLLASQAKLDKDFQPKNESAVDAFISAVKGVPALKKQAVDGTPFLKYFVTKVAPVLDQVSVPARIALVRNVSGIASSIDSKAARVLLPQVWEIIKRYVPLAAVKTEVEERKADEANHALFSVEEALLHLTVQLAAQTVEGARDVLGIFVATGQPSDFAAESKKNETVQRLTHLQSSVQQWSKSLQPAIQTIKKELKEEKDEEKKKASRQKLSSLIADQRVTASLKALIAPLLEKTPVLTSTGSVSWRKGADKTSEGKGKKGSADGKGKAKGKGGDKQKDSDKGNKKAESKKGKQSAVASSSSSSTQQGKKQKNAEQKENTSTSNKKRKAEGGAGQPATTRPTSAAPLSSSSGSNQKRKRQAGGDANGQDQQQQQQQQQKSKKRKSDAGQQPGGQQQQSQSKKRKGDGGGQVPQQQQLFQQVAAQAQAAATQAYINQLQAASQQFYNPLALQMAAAFGGKPQQGGNQQGNRRGGTQQHRGGGNRISGRQSIGQRNQQNSRSSAGNAGRRGGRGRGRS